MFNSIDNYTILEEILIKEGVKNVLNENENQFIIITNRDTILTFVNDSRGWGTPYVLDICGDVADMIEGNVISFEGVEIKIYESDENREDDYIIGTFFKIQTTKGHITIRFYSEGGEYYAYPVYPQLETKDKDFYFYLNNFQNYFMPLHCIYNTYNIKRSEIKETLNKILKLKEKYAISDERIAKLIGVTATHIHEERPNSPKKPNTRHFLEECFKNGLLNINNLETIVKKNNKL